MKCEICGKREGKGNLVSHSKTKTKRQFRVNLQNAMVLYKGEWKKMNICSKCRRAHARNDEQKSPEQGMVK